ncbi:hypothetical protein BT96DRAFT_843597, partial [Gymnopus androsaceus JB14]
YPAIYQLAMDIIPAQGTLVPSECVFSSAGKTNTDCCSHLSLEMMEALQVSVGWAVGNGQKSWSFFDD